MTVSENRKRYISLHRILFVVTLSIIATLCTGASVFAAEITPAVVVPTVTATPTPAAGDSASTDTEGAATKEETLEDGYTVDDQGQVFYNGVAVTTEETEIFSVPEDAADSEVTDSEEVSEVEEDAEVEAEETTEAKVTTADKSSTQTSTKTSSKSKTTTTTKTKAAQTKVEKPAYSEADLRLLSCLIYAEAGNQSYKGMVAVANVVINRAKSDVYWHVNTIKEVIYDRKWSVQFSVTIENSKTGISPYEKALKIYDSGKYTGANPEAEKSSMQRAIKAAKAALQGTNNIGNYLCFTNKRAAGSIKKKYPDYRIIGDHIFYRTK